MKLDIKEIFKKTIKMFFICSIFVFINMNCDFSFGMTPLSFTVFIFCCYLLIHFKLTDLYKYKTFLNIICSILFGIIYIFGREYLWKTNFFHGLSLQKFVIIFIQCIIISFLFYEFIIIIHNKNNNYLKYNNKFMNILNEDNTKKIFFTILMCWFPYIILIYPCFICEDSLLELAQFYGFSNIYSSSVLLINTKQLITAHHPIIYTYLIGFFSKFININIGLYIYNILQTLFVIYTISKLLLFVNERLKNNRILSYMFIIICFYPFIPYLFSTLEKDTLFACIFMFFSMNLYEYIYEKKLNIISFIILSMLLILLRNNVKYVYFLFLILLFIFKKKDRKKIFIIGICIVFTIIGNMMFCNLKQISPTSKAEMLSIPFQQTARYIKYYKTEVTNKEKTTINKILDYDNLSKLYKPRISDPVKDTFKNKKVTNQDLKEYFIIWFQMFLKHPMCYIETVLQMQIENFNISIISIHTNSRSYSIRNKLLNNQYKSLDIHNFSKFGFKTNLTINKFGKFIEKYVFIMSNIPIIGLISIPATYFWMFILIILESINKKQIKNILLFSSFYLLYYFTIFLGPCDAVYQFRYCYPFFVSCPIFYLIWVRLKEIDLSTPNT